MDTTRRKDEKRGERNRTNEHPATKSAIVIPEKRVVSSLRENSFSKRRRRRRRLENFPSSSSSSSSFLFLASSSLFFFFFFTSSREDPVLFSGRFHWASSHFYTPVSLRLLTPSPSSFSSSRYENSSPFKKASLLLISSIEFHEHIYTCIHVCLIYYIFPLSLSHIFFFFFLRIIRN